MQYSICPNVDSKLKGIKERETMHTGKALLQSMILQIQLEGKLSYYILLFCYWAYLIKCLERIMPPYFILLHIAQMAIRSNKYSKRITKILPENYCTIHKNRKNLFLSKYERSDNEKSPILWFFISITTFGDGEFKLGILLQKGGVTTNGSMSHRHIQTRASHSKHNNMVCD